MKQEVVTLAGGCFWCTEAIFQRLKGVEKVISGYSGGNIENPTYEEVSSGNTGYAEAIQIFFNPEVIPFNKILEIFWHFHDPTTLNQQGADIGTQYRSAIFYHNKKQKEMAVKSKNNIEKSNFYTHPIVTEIIPFKNFYPAEEYHQNFYNLNPNYPYCNIVIEPKLIKLLKEYKIDIKS